MIEHITHGHLHRVPLFALIEVRERIAAAVKHDIFAVRRNVYVNAKYVERGVNSLCNELFFRQARNRSSERRLCVVGRFGIEFHNSFPSFIFGYPRNKQIGTVCRHADRSVLMIEIVELNAPFFNNNVRAVFILYKPDPIDIYVKRTGIVIIRKEEVPRIFRREPLIETIEEASRRKICRVPPLVDITQIILPVVLYKIEDHVIRRHVLHVEMNC